MGKKLYITQEQLNEILGDGGQYLDSGSDGNVKEPGYNEVSVNPLTDGKPITTDDHMRERGRRELFMGRPGGNPGGVIPAAGALTYESKTINEVADGVKNKKYKPSGQLLLALKANMNSLRPGDMYYKVLKTLLNPEGVSENYLSNLLSDMESGKVPQEKIELLAGPLFIRWGKQCITNRQTIDANFKKSRYEAGEENVYQKPGGTKGDGVAHTPKDDGSITYGRF